MTRVQVILVEDVCESLDGSNDIVVSEQCFGRNEIRLGRGMRVDRVENNNYREEENQCPHAISPVHTAGGVLE